MMLQIRPDIAINTDQVVSIVEGRHAEQGAVLRFTMVDGLTFDITGITLNEFGRGRGMRPWKQLPGV